MDLKDFEKVKWSPEYITILHKTEIDLVSYVKTAGDVIAVLDGEIWDYVLCYWGRYSGFFSNSHNWSRCITYDAENWGVSIYGKSYFLITEMITKTISHNGPTSLVCCGETMTYINLALKCNICWKVV